MTKQAKLKKQAYESNLKSRALSVLIYLIDRSNEDLTCFPAIGTIAEQLHISVSTVKRALRELVEEGYIEKDSRFRAKNMGQTSNLYTLNFRTEEKESVEHITFETLKEESEKNQEEEVNQETIIGSKVIKELPKGECFIPAFRIMIFDEILNLQSWTGEGVTLQPP